jgi:hypothetical protein
LIIIISSLRAPVAPYHCKAAANSGLETRKVLALEGQLFNVFKYYCYFEGLNRRLGGWKLGSFHLALVTTTTTTTTVIRITGVNISMCDDWFSHIPFEWLLSPNPFYSELCTGDSRGLLNFSILNYSDCIAMSKDITSLMATSSISFMNSHLSEE